MIPIRDVGISVPKQNANELKALCLYLNSQLTSYFVFFNTPQWGVFKQAKQVNTTVIYEIPVPSFSSEQINGLAHFHDEIVEYENKNVRKFIDDAQKAHNSLVFSKKNDEHIEALVTKLMPAEKAKLKLDTPSQRASVFRKPSVQELLQYAIEIRDELDDFLMGSAFHKIDVTYSDELIECKIEITKSSHPLPVTRNNIKKGELTISKALSKLSDNLKVQKSQWVYTQRGLRLFDGPHVYLYKQPRLIEWTRTQAMLDAGDIIGEILKAGQTA